MNPRFEAEPGRRIEVHITDSDRRVDFTADEGLADAADEDVADAIVDALRSGDPGDAERRLQSGLGDFGTVRSGP
jgi:hypothetical protein